jgi:broad-specificity NMP kinase
MTMQSRLAVNAVTLGNFDEPIKISIFVKDLFTGFSMVNSVALRPFPSLNLTFLLQSNQLNLKNDTLRRRFDSLKYDIKKIEEGNEATLFDFVDNDSSSTMCIVVYDVSLRKLAPAPHTSEVES